MIIVRNAHGHSLGNGKNVTVFNRLPTRIGMALTCVFMANGGLVKAQPPIGTTEYIHYADAAEGVAYYLPKAYFEISVKPPDDLEKDKPKDPTVTGLFVNVSPATASATGGSAVVGPTPTPTEGGGGSKSTILKSEVTITPRLVPDLDYVYYLRHLHSAWRDDGLSVDVESNGLLKAVNASATDRTGDIFLAAVDLVAQAAKVFVAFQSGGTGVTPFVEFSEEPCPKPCKPKPVYGSVDLSQSKSLENFNATLKDANYPFYLKVECKDQQVASQRIAPGSCFDGVVYRAPVPVALKFYRREMDKCGCPLSKTQELLGGSVQIIPQPDHVVLLPLEQGRFSKVEYKLAFSKGILTHYEGSRPSEILAAINIPVNALKTLASIPGELLTIRVNNAKSQTDLLKAQKDLLDAQAALIKAQQTAGVVGQQP